MPSSVCKDTWSLRQQQELLKKKWGSSFTHHNQTEGNSTCHQTGIPESPWTACPWPQLYLYSRCDAVEENTALSSHLQVAIEDLSLLQALVVLFPKWGVHWKYFLLSTVSFNSHSASARPKAAINSPETSCVPMNPSGASTLAGK